jgi:hypothetical protein
MNPALSLKFTLSDHKAVTVFVKLQFPLKLDYGRSPHAYVNQRLQIQLQLLMMSSMALKTF